MRLLNWLTDPNIRNAGFRGARRRLSTESLEDRLMFSAGPPVPGPTPPDQTDMDLPGPEVTFEPPETIVLEDDVLKVNGTAGNDEIEVRYSSFVHWIDINTPIEFPAIEATIRDGSGNIVESQKFHTHLVSEVIIRAFGGHDTVTNDTALPSLIYGGPGNDNLYGGLGVDEIWGDAGRDGLFGGDATGHDKMHGGSGADRFLDIADSAVDMVWDYDGGGTNIWFYSGSGGEFQFQGFADPGTFDPASWSPAEVRWVDEALAELHHTTGNTDLLRTEAHFPVWFYRQGAQTSGPAVNAWNGGGKINVTQNAFTTHDELLQTIFHEMGHNWDEENPFWSEFLAISGWVDSAPTADHVPATSETESWWYDSSATFAREYGKTNPVEDFATAFAAYFMDQSGHPYGGGPGAAAIPEKINLISNFLGSMSEYQFMIVDPSLLTRVTSNSNDDGRQDRAGRLPEPPVPKAADFDLRSDIFTELGRTVRPAGKAGEASASQSDVVREAAFAEIGGMPESPTPAAPPVAQRQSSPAARPSIGPFYPYPQVPLGWHDADLEWDDGWWFLDFKQ